jgi:alanine racemase
MVRRLMQSGVDYFAVANAAEAAEIRHMGAGWPILLLSPTLPEEDGQLIEQKLTATVSTREECERLHALAEHRQTPLKVHLKIDTGMGRLGIWHSRAADLLADILRMPWLRLEGAYTHFSSAENDPEFTRLQRERFLAVLNAAPDLPDDLIIHADNSAGLDSLSETSPYNAVRVGLLQFGVSPYQGSAFGRVQVEPVFSFHTRIGLIKDLPAHTDISYGRTHRLTRDTRTAVLTAGYGDGIPLELSNCGHVLIRGQACPILGRITMDQTVVDVTDCPEAATGDPVVLIGSDRDREITAGEFSEQSGSIPWETLCSVTKRVTRVYIGSREL